MLKDILPEELKNTKFGKGHDCCSYNYVGDYISFNRKEIVADKDFNNIWQMYFHRKLSRKEILITSLLHELGHRKFRLDNPRYIQKWKKEFNLFQRKYNINGITKWNISYWHEIEAEREAMTFAKEYFIRYLIRDIARKTINAI